jgi:hypothetical protein
MAAITVTKTSTGKYEVVVAMQTTHSVTLSDDYYRELSGGHVTEEELIKKSFAFLLERESNAMILRQFDLPLIGSYFPEFEETINQSFT